MSAENGMLKFKRVRRLPLTATGRIAALTRWYNTYRPFFKYRVGIEIGGPSPIFRGLGLVPIYTVAARIDNCNFGTETAWGATIKPGQTFLFNKGQPPGHQYVAEADDLPFASPELYDFVLSSHMLEHTANPLKALQEWTRILKPLGALLLVLPHKDGTFDHRRPTTSIKHLLEDFEHKTDETDLTHLAEILKLHDLSLDPGAGTYEEFRVRGEKNCTNRCLHHHVFDTELAVKVLDQMALEIVSAIPALPRHIIVLATKPAGRSKPDNTRFLGPSASYRSGSPFPSDRHA